MGRHKPKISKPVDPGQWHEYRTSERHVIRENRIFIECSISIDEANRCGFADPIPVSYGKEILVRPSISDKWMVYCDPFGRDRFLLTFRYRIPRTARAFEREYRTEVRLPWLMLAACGFDHGTPLGILADWLEEHSFSLSVMMLRYWGKIRSVQSPRFASIDPLVPITNIDTSIPLDIPRQYFGHMGSRYNSKTRTASSARYRLP